MSLVLSVRPEDPRPIYVQIVDEVRRAVVRGTLKPGDSLPSVRELARRLKVNPTTIQQAYRELDHEGLARSERGRGTFVTPESVRDPGLRRRVEHDVAGIALREAVRAGLTTDELIRAIRERDHASEQDEGEMNP